MRPEYIGVKYYSSNDMSIGYNFEQAKKLLDALDENKEYTDVNEIIELYNVNQIITSPGIKAEYSTPYLKKATGLRDLYEHGVICASYYKNADILDRLVGSGDLRFDSSLFSIPEQNYLNYMLNKSEYSNGLDLRNKYIHSTYPTDVNQQEHDYINLLKIMVIVILKINEEFCLMNPV